VKSAAARTAGALAFAAIALTPAAARAALPDDAPTAATRTANGFAGPSVGFDRGVAREPGFEVLPDRWRIGFPAWRRYGDAPTEAPYEKGAWWDPYHQNVLKGDYPILGDHTFLEVTGVSDTLVEGRAFPLASGVSTARPRSEAFFGGFDQLLFEQTLALTAEVFYGDAAFRPKDAALRVTPVFDLNYLDTDENGVTDIDVRKGTRRTDHHVGFQDLSVEKHLVDLSPNYDFITMIAGIQPFTSDFRGFLFADDTLGARLQANLGANRYQANLAWFHELEKDTNSGLNTFDLRDQDIFIANFFCQDFLSEVSHLFEGYTLELSWHYDRDHSGAKFDGNGFLVRPARIGESAGALADLREKDVDVHYLGWGGDGHIGRLNITHQYYFAVGRESRNEIAGRAVDVRAHFGAVEASVDVDWLRLKASFLYASGDRNPRDGVATGFDSIIDNPFFAGAGFSYWNRQAIPLLGASVNLVNRLSILPDLRTSKTQGQANFVNPGLFLYNVGASARVTPEVTAEINASLLRFADTAALEYVLEQDRIDAAIGVDLNAGVQWRPLLTENVIVTVGAAALFPGAGFRAIYTGDPLYSTFFALTLTW
jgi:hypothetical protein